MSMFFGYFEAQLTKTDNNVKHRRVILLLEPQLMSQFSVVCCPSKKSVVKCGGSLYVSCPKFPENNFYRRQIKMTGHVAIVQSE